MIAARRHFSRRTILVGLAGATGLAGHARAAAPEEDDEAVAFIAKLTGRRPIVSDRLRLVMPREFPTGFTVPLTLEMDSPMSEADHVRRFDVVAPRNPIVDVVSFHFMPLRSEPRVATRVRLAGPQTVVALADMSDGMLLMATTFVSVATNGCT